MANWTSGILTNRGRDLQLKVEAGEKLKMTRFKLGDGMETTAEAADLNDLIGAKIAFGWNALQVYWRCHEHRCFGGVSCAGVGAFCRGPRPWGNPLHDRT